MERGPIDAVPEVVLEGMYREQNQVLQPLPAPRERLQVGLSDAIEGCDGSTEPLVWVRAARVRRA